MKPGDKVKEFILGDVVVIIADGPKMAVEGYLVNEETPGQFTESDELGNVVYFTGDSFKRDTFHQDLMMFIDEVA